jgi:hypothetical protein
MEFLLQLRKNGFNVQRSDSSCEFGAAVVYSAVPMREADELCREILLPACNPCYAVCRCAGRDTGHSLPEMESRDLPGPPTQSP